MSLFSIAKHLSTQDIPNTILHKPYQQPVYDEKLNLIIEEFLRRSEANLVIEYASSLENLIKKGNVLRIGVLFQSNNISNLPKPAIYGCIAAAIFGQGDVLKWLLRSKFLKNEIANNNELREFFFKVICMCAKEFKHDHILIIFRNFLCGSSRFLLPGSNFFPETTQILAFIDQKQGQTNQTLRSNLILTGQYTLLALHLEEILSSSIGYDEVFDVMEYVTFTGKEIFVLKRNGFFTFYSSDSGLTSFDSFLKKGNRCKYYLHKTHLQIAIDHLKSEPTQQWVPTDKQSMIEYLENECLFPIIEQDPELLNAREPLYELINKQEFALFAKDAIGDPDVCNEDLYNACLQDYILYKFDYFCNSMTESIFGKSIYSKTYKNPFL